MFQLQAVWLLRMNPASPMQAQPYLQLPRAASAALPSRLFGDYAVGWTPPDSPSFLLRARRQSRRLGWLLAGAAGSRARRSGSAAVRSCAPSRRPRGPSLDLHIAPPPLPADPLRLRGPAGAAPSAAGAGSPSSSPPRARLRRAQPFLRTAVSADWRECLRLSVLGSLDAGRCRLGEQLH